MKALYSSIKALSLLALVMICRKSNAQDIYISAVQGAFNTNQVAVSNILREDIVEEELESRTGTKKKTSPANKDTNIFAALPPVKNASAPVKITEGTYNPDNGITQKVNAAFIEQIARVNPSGKADIARVVNSGLLQKDAATRLSALGLNAHNIVDVMVSYYAVMWQIASGKEATPRQLIAGYNQLAPGLAATKLVKDLNAVKKQELSEHMILVAMVAMGTYQNLLQKHDTKGMERLKRSVNEMMLQQHIDLAAMQLTESGWTKM